MWYLLGIEPKNISVSYCIVLELIPLSDEDTFQVMPTKIILISLGDYFKISDKNPCNKYMGFPLLGIRDQYGSEAFRISSYVRCNSLVSSLFCEKRNLKVSEPCYNDYINNSLNLQQKYAWIFVCGQYLFQEGFTVF